VPALRRHSVERFKQYQGYPARKDNLHLNGVCNRWSPREVGRRTHKGTTPTLPKLKDELSQGALRFLFCPHIQNGPGLDHVVRGTRYGRRENQAEGMDRSIQGLDLVEQVGRPHQRIVKRDVLGQEFRRADQGDTFGLRSPFCRRDLLWHPRVVGIAHEHEYAVKGENDDLSIDQCVNGTGSMRGISQLQDLTGRGLFRTHSTISVVR
jgi:hypothetical protein